MTYLHRLRRRIKPNLPKIGVQREDTWHDGAAGHKIAGLGGTQECGFGGQVVPQSLRWLGHVVRSDMWGIWVQPWCAT